MLRRAPASGTDTPVRSAREVSATSRSWPEGSSVRGSAGRSQPRYPCTASEWQKTASAPSLCIRRTSAAEAPIASPSAPTWVVTATLSRVFKKSAISLRVLFFVRVVIGPYLPEGRLYPGRAFYHRIRLEVQFGRALEARLATDGALNASGRALQALVGRLGILSGQDAVKDRSVGQVRAYTDARHGHQTLNARVGERGDLFACDLLQLRLDLACALAHSFALIASRTPRASPGSRVPRS